tara:strand:+ start:2571 stop:3413 length:843 start_codon:yes stop_codon:yes gene_type:complete
MSLKENSILVKLKVSQWTARKYDRNISDELTTKHNASHDYARVNKVLVDIQEIKKITKSANEIRNFHNTNTLPWMQDGIGILPIANHSKYIEGMRELKTKFQEQVESFQRQYEHLVSTAQVKLGSMFDPSDYPSSSSIADKFSIDVDMFPIPDSKDFRVDLDEDIINDMKKNLESKIKDAQEEAMKDLWNRLYGTVTHMAEKLTDPSSRFKNSLVGNIDDLVKLLPKLNVSNDPNLENMRKEVANKLSAYDPEDLRTDKKVRSQAAQEAKDIVDKMKGFM